MENKELALNIRREETNVRLAKANAQILKACAAALKDPANIPHVIEVLNDEAASFIGDAEQAQARLRELRSQLPKKGM